MDTIAQVTRKAEQRLLNAGQGDSAAEPDSATDAGFVGVQARRAGSAGSSAVAGGDTNTKTNKSGGWDWSRVQKRLKAKFGQDIYSSWFASLELEHFDGASVHLTVPHRFLQSWIQAHYVEDLLACCADELKGAERVRIKVRTPGRVSENTGREAPGDTPVEARGTASAEAIGCIGAEGGAFAPAAQDPTSTGYGDFQGSPLDPQLTFESFVVGGSNRLAHAAAQQVSERLLNRPLGFNPLYIHSNVGLGKTHLLHAIAWDVRRRHPTAKVLYLTAERFRYRFVEALQSKESLSFKESLRGIDILLIDDMEFLHGAKTEQEFDDTLNALLDSGKQVVVASARPPGQLDKLDPRMRSRLSGGLVTELGPLDFELRRKILERRASERQRNDPSFQITGEVVDFLAERLTENGRELEGAVTRLYAACHLTGAPITRDSAEHIIRDLMRGLEPKRIRIDDILKLVSKHYGVSRTDILSQRRQRSIVWPRQIGMFLAKRLTSQSLPEIGRRFGGRDHTTVLHAIRKIESEVEGDNRLRDEIEDLTRLLNN